METFDVRSIEVFRAVVEAGSATAAAENLKVSQPAVTRSIAEFEQKCGLNLFRRGRHGMTLTPDGKLLYEEVLRSYVGLDRIASAVRAIQSGKRGDLRIVSIPALVEGSVGRLLGEFARANSEVRLQIAVETQEGVLRAVALELADLGFLFGPVSPQPHIDAAPIGTRRMLVVLPADHSLALKPSLRIDDLVDERIIMISPPHTIRSIVELRFFEAAARQPLVACEAATQKAVVAMVGTGAGVAFIDSEVANQIDGRLVATVPLEPAVTWTIQTVRNKDRYISGPLRSLLRSIRIGASAIDTTEGETEPRRNVRKLRPRAV